MLLHFPCCHSVCRLGGGPRPLTPLAALSDPAGAAPAPSGPPVTLAAVFTVTLLEALLPKPTHITLCKTGAQEA